MADTPSPTPPKHGVGAPARPGIVVLSAFAVFGAVWGIYAAAVPAVKSATGASDAVLGAALSCAGLTALPAMFLLGRLVDRYGRHAFLGVCVLFALSAPLALFAGSVPVLIVALLVFGACSGAYDVAINHAAVRFEAAARRPLLNKAHAVFSVGLLIGSLGTGALRAAGLRPAWALVAVGAVLLVGAIPAWRAQAGTRGAATISAPVPAQNARQAPGHAATRARPRLGPLVWVLGGCGILALIVESGVQQWSAVLLEDSLHAAPAVSALGPTVFAAAEALGRASGQRLISRFGDVRMLICAGLVAAPGTILLALAGNPPFALLAIAVTGLGISVAAPTLYGLAGRDAAPQDRGRTIAAVSGVAYLGLLGGPSLVGQIAGATNLRLAFGLLAPVALFMAICIRTAHHRRPAPRPTNDSEN